MTETVTSKETRESLITRFNVLNYKVSVYDETVSREQNAAYRAEAEHLLARFSPEERKEFLWDCVRQVIIDGSKWLVKELNSDPVRRYYYVGGIVSISDEDDMSIHGLIRAAIQRFAPVSIEPPELDSGESIEFNEPGFFDQLDVVHDHPELVGACMFVGHETLYVPAFSAFVLLGQQGSVKTTRDMHGLAYKIKPELWRGVKDTYEAFRMMVEEKFPLREETSLTEILNVVLAEGAVRAGVYRGKVRYCGVDYVNKGSTGMVSIDAPINSELEITGCEAALHSLFYQLVKNPIVIFDEKNIKDAKLLIQAREVEINGQKMVAVRIADNGPGFDTEGILRSAKRIIGNKQGELTPLERRVVEDQASSRDIINCIFMRGVSAAKPNSAHQGIGLALVKEMVELHHGAVFAMNNSDREEFMEGKGARFVVLLDPNGDGSLKQNLPELFDPDTTPTEILSEIEKQLER